MLRVASSRRTMIASGGLLVLGSGLVASQQYAHSEAQQKASWESTLEKSLPAVVALKMSTPCAFDTFAPGNSRATGFVVDAERGLILTNRHVAGGGPIEGEAIFQNNEAVAVRTVWVDPIHGKDNLLKRHPTPDT